MNLYFLLEELKIWHSMAGKPNHLPQGIKASCESHCADLAVHIWVSTDHYCRDETTPRTSPWRIVDGNHHIKGA